MPRDPCNFPIVIQQFCESPLKERASDILKESHETEIHVEIWWQ